MPAKSETAEHGIKNKVSKSIQAIRGMNDCLPAQTPAWQYVEGVLKSVVASFGYQEIRMPIVEQTDLFKRSIGEVTDIVEKEMYTFEDRNGDSLTLRPEGTASCVRAGNQHGLLYNQEQRLWYMGPMFRHERPQKGRYRQFHQFGVETYGLGAPDVDVELLQLSADIWQRLGIADLVTLQINSLGTNEARARYRDVLVAYLEEHIDEIDEDSRRRLHRNPLRVLDTKDPATRAIVDNGPQLTDYLDDESRAHFEKLCATLTQLGIQYEINPALVRGLDYYSETVFEWVTDALGAQGTVCAGGRYDGLVKQLGGRDTPAMGFAIGIERLILLLTELNKLGNLPPAAQVYNIALGENCQIESLKLANTLRAQLPHLRIMQHMGSYNAKKAMKRADKSDAPLALLLGEDELQTQSVTLKFLREDRPQEQLSWAELPARLSELLD